MIALAEIEAARERIRGRVRRTPMLRPAPVPGVPAGVDLTLKLECLQVTGSFKARGATNKLLSLSPAEVARGLVTASGGNHGLAVAYVGGLAGVPVTIYLPANAPAAKERRLRELGAEVVRAGEVWDDAHAAGVAAAEESGRTYLHPFDDPAIVAGQGTLGLEILEDAPDAGLLLVAIGGGGLISGVAAAVHAAAPHVRVVGVEPVGAPTLHDSLAAGRVVTLPELRTAANTLAAKRTGELNFEIARSAVERVVLVTDEEMREAARWLWRELGVGAELSGAASLAALLSGKVRPAAGESACALICGAGTDGMS